MKPWRCVCRALSIALDQRQAVLTTTTANASTDSMDTFFLPATLASRMIRVPLFSALPEFSEFKGPSGLKGGPVAARYHMIRTANFEYRLPFLYNRRKVTPEVKHMVKHLLAVEANEARLARAPETR